MFKSLTVLLLSVLMSASFAAKESSGNVDAEYVKKAIKKDNVEIIDLRTSIEIGITGKIPGAKVKNYFMPGFDDYVKSLDPKKEYIVYCKSGGRSAKAAKKMKEAGLKVKNYSGGMDDWQEQKKD